MCFFLRDKIKINMVIPVFRKSKGEDPEVFLRKYKRACIGMSLEQLRNGLIFFLNY